jgi:hypothetical protein
MSVIWKQNGKTFLSGKSPKLKLSDKGNLNETNGFQSSFIKPVAIAMIEEFLMPLDRHFDSGFGATADSFHQAAKALDTDSHKNGFGLNSSRLPVFYLYRHANELYLKSVLTILHRRFCSTFPNVRTDFPAITVDGKPKRIFQVHSIRHLYRQFRNILNDNASQIVAIAKTDWTAVPEELDASVDLINDADESSTMFRYPITLDPENDAKKSSFKRIYPEDAVAAAHYRTENNLPGIKVLALENNDGEIVETFIHDENAMPDVFVALKHLAETLSGAQFGMRYELLNAR